MKKVIVKKLDGSFLHIREIEDADAFIQECIASSAWGLPERPEVDVDGIETGVILPAEYTVEVIDITAEHDLQVCFQKRRMEYPSPEDFMNAFYDGGQDALDALQAARLAIKAKYPKPT